MSSAYFTHDDVREIRHFHLFCGLGGGAKGFNKASPRVGNMVGRFRCIGGVDVDASALRDFERLTGTRGTVLDLFDRSQFEDFHGKEPPAGWREATPADIRAAAGGDYPHIAFLSAPCKGFSGLLNETRSKTAKYQALNRLTLRGVWLMLEAFADDPPALIIFENVPRAMVRGRHLLDQIGEMLRSYGYAVAETTHDCGEIGALAQSRKRFLLVARHVEKVPPFLYEPEKKRLQAIGTVLDRMPLPGEATGGPLHRVPQLQWKTWVRLAFVEAGSDWRSLNRLAIDEGIVRDYLIVPEVRDSAFGMSVANESSGAFPASDPRFNQSRRWNDGQSYGVRRWDKSSGTIAGQTNPGQGVYSVADPRIEGVRHNNVFRIVAWRQHAQTVTAGGHPTAGGQCVADPRSVMHRSHDGFAWEQDGGSDLSSSPFHGHGVRPGAASTLPAPSERLTAVIRALDGTWHRPFTTLELAALQSLIDPEEYLELDGLSDSAWRERIGNAVPPDAAEAIASVMGTTLLLAWSGETFVLSAAPIWVRPVAMALSLPDQFAEQWPVSLPRSLK